jgi:hypothetical protein
VGDNKANALLSALTTDTPSERINTPPPRPAAVVPVVTDLEPEITTEPITPTPSPQTAVDVAPGLVITPTLVQPAAATADAVAVPAVVQARRPLVRTWPVLVVGLGAFIAIWAGWVELGRLTGFGIVHPLPGIWDSFKLNTAIVLPLGMDAYAAFALKVWLTPGIPHRARRFARWSTVAALLVGMAGQVAYHLMAAQNMTTAPWQITTAVSCLPVIVLGLASALAHLVRADNDN